MEYNPTEKKLRKRIAELERKIRKLNFQIDVGDTIIAKYRRERNDFKLLLEKRENEIEERKAYMDMEITRLEAEKITIREKVGDLDVIMFVTPSEIKKSILDIIKSVEGGKK
jgi:predicted  nucleic acid-binding Zn-ribbon protein